MKHSLLNRSGTKRFIVFVTIFTLFLAKPVLAIDYELLSGSDITEDVLKASAHLFSNHYGNWGIGGYRPNKPVSLTALKLGREFFFDNACGVARATISKGDSREQIGHAIFRKFHVKTIGEVYWISQLVVHRSYRHQGIASHLIRLIVQSGYDACGLVSSHPYAVRSLEKATNRICDPETIILNASALIEGSELTYVKGKPFDSENGSCRINTEFFVDHSDLLDILEHESTNSRNWKLGSLTDGFEFFAFVFS